MIILILYIGKNTQQCWKNPNLENKTGLYHDQTMIIFWNHYNRRKYHIVISIMIKASITVPNCVGLYYDKTVIIDMKLGEHNYLPMQKQTRWC